MRIILKTLFILLASFNLMGQVRNDTITVNINPTPPKVSIKALPNLIYTGDSTLISASGCNGTFIWNIKLTNSSGFWENNKKVDFPTKSSWYKAYCRSVQGCDGIADSVQVIVKANVPKIIASAAEICQGEKSMLTASGCINGVYKWSTGVTGNTITVTPSQTTNYEVICENISGISEPSTIRVTVKNRPTSPTLSASKLNINTGETVNISASSCNGTITWSNGQNGTIISVTLSQTTTYKVRCIENGCDGPESSITIGVYSPIPTIEGSHKEICTGNEVTLTAYGCSGSINWNNGINNAVSIKVNPAQTTTYEAVCNTTAGGSAPAKFTVTVYSYPSAPFVNSTTIVVGNYATLNAGGCNGSYQWNIGATTQSISVNPTNYTEYKVKCIQNGCPSPEAVATVNVISPNSEVWASPDKICKGQSTRLYAKGCIGTYKWSNGETGESISVTLSQTMQYNVICSTSAGDGTPAYVTVTVYDVPNKPVMFGDTLITSGKTATIKAVCSANSVRWSTGDSTETIKVKPSVTTWYKAFCVSSQGCVGKTDSIRVKVTTPPIEIFPEDKPIKLVNNKKTIEICEGEKPKLNLIGCESSSKVQWNTGETTRAIIVGPLKNTSYWAKCTDLAGIKYDSLNVVVFPKPKISSTKDTIKVILGNQTTLKVFNCTDKVTWFNAISPNNSLPISNGPDTLQIKPTQNITIYRAFCTNTNGCNSDTLKYVVVALPMKPSVEVPSKICEGSNITLKGNSCPPNTMFTWEVSKGAKKEKFEGNTLETIFSKTNTYVAYCTSISNPTIKGDTLNIKLKPSPISLDNVIVYPNPTYDVISIISDGCLNGINFKLWDISGRMLYDGLGIEEKDRLQLSLSDLPSAEYILQISATEPQKTVNKLILKANKK